MTEAEKWAAVLGVPTDADAPTICRAFEKLAVRLCPVEFGPGGLPLYAVATSSLPTGFKAASKHTAGWHSHVLHRWLRDAGAIEWRGEGPGILIHDAPAGAEDIRKIRRQLDDGLQARGLSPDPAEVDFMATLMAGGPPSFESICGTLLHELGHAIQSIVKDWYEVLADPITYRPSAAKCIADRFDSLVTRKTEEVKPPTAQLDSHGLDFVRIGAHLCHRLGFVPADIGVAGAYYQQAQFAACIDAMGTEPRRMMGRPFSRILKLPMSPAFVACQLGEAAA